MEKVSARVLIWTKLCQIFEYFLRTRKRQSPGFLTSALVDRRFTIVWTRRISKKALRFAFPIRLKNPSCCRKQTIVMTPTEQSCRQIEGEFARVNVKTK